MHGREGKREGGRRRAMAFKYPKRALRIPVDCMTMNDVSIDSIMAM